MARIPLAEVPNAPGLTEPVLTNYPERKLDLSGVTRSLMMEPIKQGSFDGPAEGLAAIGEALGETGRKAVAVVRDFQEAKAAAKDYDATNQAGLMFERERKELGTKLAGLSEKEMVPLLKDYEERTRQQLDGLSFTDRGRLWAKDYHRQQMGVATQMAQDADVATLTQRGRTNAIQRHQSLIDAGDYEGAEAVRRGGVRSGMFRADEAKAMEEGALMSVERGRASAFVQEDPWAAQGYFAKAEKEGKSEMYPRMSREELANLRTQAGQAIVARQREVSDGLDDKILSGDVRDEGTIRSMAAAGRLPKADVDSLVKGLRDVPVARPEDRVNYLRAQSDIITKLAGYDAEQDTEDKEYYAIKRMIREGVPTTQRKAALDDLQRRRDGKRTESDEVKWNKYQIIDAISDEGLLGAKGLDDKGSVIDAGREIERQRKALLLKSAVEQYIRKNPEASPKAVDERVSELLKGMGITNEAAKNLRRRGVIIGR